MISWDLIVLTGVSWDVSHWNWSELWEFDSRGFDPPALFHTFFHGTNWRVQLRATPKPLPPVSFSCQETARSWRCWSLDWSRSQSLHWDEAQRAVASLVGSVLQWTLWRYVGDMLDDGVLGSAGIEIPNFGFEKYDIPRLWLIGCVYHLQLQFQSAPGS